MVTPENIGKKFEAVMPAVPERGQYLQDIVNRVSTLEVRFDKLLEEAFSRGWPHSKELDSIENSLCDGSSGLEQTKDHAVVELPSNHVHQVKHKTDPYAHSGQSAVYGNIYGYNGIHKDLLVQQRKFLVDSLTLSELKSIEDALIAEKCITDDDRENIHKDSILKDNIRELLVLLPKKGINAFVVFKHELASLVRPDNKMKHIFDISEHSLQGTADVGINVDVTALQQHQLQNIVQQQRLEVIRSYHGSVHFTILYKTLKELDRFWMVTHSRLVLEQIKRVLTPSQNATMINKLICDISFTEYMALRRLYLHATKGFLLETHDDSCIGITHDKLHTMKYKDDTVLLYPQNISPFKILLNLHREYIIEKEKMALLEHKSRLELVPKGKVIENLEEENTRLKATIDYLQKDTVPQEYDADGKNTFNILNKTADMSYEQDTNGKNTFSIPNIIGGPLTERTDILTYYTTTIDCKKPVQGSGSSIDGIDGSKGLSVFPHGNMEENSAASIPTPKNVQFDVCHQQAHAREELVMDSGNKTCKARGGLDTVLCLDTSGSMKGTPFKEMQDAVMDILLAIEDATKENGVDENIAIVTFGGGVQVVQTLTNDFNRLKKIIHNLKPGGRSPMVEGMIVAHKEVREHGGRLRISDRVVPSRLVLITDGYATDDSHLMGEDFTIKADGQIKMKVMSSTTLFCRNLNTSSKQPTTITCIGCGDFDQLFLKSIARVGMGVLLNANDHDAIRRKIGDHFRKTTVVYKFARAYHGDVKPVGENRDVFQSFIEGTLGETFDNDDLEEMMKMLENLPPTYSETNDTKENTSMRELPNYPPLGSRVRRGIDWEWDNQDTNGPGTVVKHNNDGTLTIRWDNGYKDRYRYGVQGAYDVLPVDDPRKLHHGQMIEVGLRVIRGPDWQADKYADKDGGQGEIGAVYRVQEDGQVYVRWGNGNTDKYRFGYDGKFDLEVLASDKFYRSKSHQTKPEKSTRVVWQKRDTSTDHWAVFPTGINDQLESAFLTDHKGTYTYSNEQKSDIQVNFPTMKEKDTLYGNESFLKREEVTDEEYNALQQSLY